MNDMSTTARLSPSHAVRSRRGKERSFVTAAALALSALCLMAPQKAMSQETPAERVTITGRVVDALSGDPIAGVEVLVRGAAGPAGDLQIITDAAGEFELSDIAVGEYRLQLSHQDYNPAMPRYW